MRQRLSAAAYRKEKIDGKIRTHRERRFSNHRQYAQRRRNGGSISASLEDESDLSNGPFRCLVRVYERYSWFGSNRVSMTLVVAGTERRYKVTVITAGGSEAVFFKLNRVGEKSFLNTVVDAIEQL